ncbi:MAG: hypothetical protein QXT64_07230 [Desulfurococcaceae archaeon]
MSVQIRVDLKELYRLLCKDCKTKLIKYVKEKMDEEFIRKQLEE